MRPATLIAAWLLAFYALGYTLLLLFFLGVLLEEAPELSVFSLLLIPAGVAFYAAFRIGRVFHGQNSGQHLLFALVLFGAAVCFGALFLSEMSVVRQTARVGGTNSPAVFVILVFAVPMVLSICIGGVYLWSGVKSFRRAQQ